MRDDIRKHEAFAAALHQLFERHEATHRLGSKKRRKRQRNIDAAQMFALQYSAEMATAYAIYAGVPKREIEAVRALIYG